MKGRSLAGALLLAAIALRLGAIAAARDQILVAHPILDGREYESWAARIAAGEVAGRGVFYQEPLYPYLLGASYAVFGRHLVVCHLLNALLETAALALLYAAARRLFGATAGALSLLLGAAYGVFLFGVVQVGKSSLDLLLVAGLLLALARFEEGDPPDRHPRRALAVGLLLGLGALNRGNLLLVAPLVVIRVLASGPAPRGARLRSAALVLAGLAIPIAPVTLRNLLVGGDTVLTTSHGGFNLYVGNHPRADGASKRIPLVRENPEFEPDDALLVASRAEGRRLRPSEASSWWARQAVGWLASHPGDAVVLYLRKLRLLVAAWELPDSVDYRFLRTQVPYLGLPWISYGIVLPLGVLGLVVARARKLRAGPLPFLLAAFALSLLPFYVFSRYRLPLVPLLLPPAGFALAYLGDAARRRSASALVLAPLLAGIALVQIPPGWIDRSFAVTRANMGHVLAEEGRIDEALAGYDAALAERPEYAGARLARAALLRRAGRAAEAESDLRAVLAADPDEWYARYDLGRILLDRGEDAQAAREFAEAIRVWPHEGSLWFGRGVALRRLEDRPGARDAFREALARDPSLDEARWNLALLLIEEGSREEARPLLEELARRRPGDPRVALLLGEVSGRNGDAPGSGAERDPGAAR